MAMAHAAATVLLSLLGLVLLLQQGQASLPPVECGETGCTVVSAYRVWVDRKDCRFSRVVYPTTEEEMVAAVAAAVRDKTKVRLVSKWAHSIPKLVCPAGDDGVLISTRDYNKTVNVDVVAGTVTVDAGVMLKDLVAILAENGRTIAHTPYWSGLSIAGLLSTGAHGSSLWGKGSAVHEYVTRIRIVVPATEAEGYAVVKTFTNSNPLEFAAVKVSLGVLGAISQVTLQIEPQFKRSLTHDLTSDSDLESRILDLPIGQEFPDVRWYPAMGQALYRLDNRVPLSTNGDGSFDLFPPVPASAMLAARTAVLLPETTRNSPGLCALASAALQQASLNGFGASNSNRSSPPEFQSYPVVGFNHRIATSPGVCSEGPLDAANPNEPKNIVCGLTDLGPHNGTSVYDVSVSLPLSETKAFISDVRKLVKKRPFGLCPADVYFGILFRFVKGDSSAYLGVSQDSVDTDVILTRSDDAHTPRLNQDLVDELEQLMVFKYRGKPHWGKNRPVGFMGVAAKYPGLPDFLRVKEQMDPEGLFSNEWTDAMLGLRGEVSQVAPFCALEGLCVCSEDVHCSPLAGYFCRPGLVYKHARVCRFEGIKRQNLPCRAVNPQTSEFNFESTGLLYSSG